MRLPHSELLNNLGICNLLYNLEISKLDSVTPHMRFDTASHSRLEKFILSNLVWDQHSVMGCGCKEETTSCLFSRSLHSNRGVRHTLLLSRKGEGTEDYTRQREKWLNLSKREQDWCLCCVLRDEEELRSGEAIESIPKQEAHRMVFLFLNFFSTHTSVGIIPVLHLFEHCLEVNFFFNKHWFTSNTRYLF